MEEITPMELLEELEKLPEGVQDPEGRSEDEI